jgi:prepilin-type processing-associated H-X9-DG protein
VRVKAYTCPSRRDGSEFTKMEAGQGGQAGSGGMGDPTRFKPGQAGDYAGNTGTFGKLNTGGQVQAVWFTVNATGTIISGATIHSDTTLPVKPQVSLGRILDGTSNTFLVGEKHVPLVGLHTVNYGDASIYNGYWVPFRARMAGLEDPMGLGPGDTVPSSAAGVNSDSTWARKFGSWHPGVCGFAFADGSVRYLRNSTGGTLLERLSSRSDGEVAAIAQ